MSSFESKTTAAAKLLKGRMGLPEAEVSSGAPYRGGPPPGSYAAQARDQQMRDAQQRQTQRLEQQTEVDALLGGPPEQIPQDAVADDGAAPESAVLLEAEPNLSSRAKTRIEELAREKNEFDRQAREARAEREQLAQQNEMLKKRLDELQTEHQNIMQAQLDHLDPDQRTRVMTEASARQAAAAAQEQIMAKMEPVLQQIQQNQFQMELTRLSQRYPAFDYEVHAAKVAATIRANPNLTVEQAFRAIAGDEELGTQVMRQVPTVLHPRGSRGTDHVAPPPPKDPDLDLVKERNEWRELAKSSDPAAKRRADQMLQAHLSKRLGLK